MIRRGATVVDANATTGGDGHSDGDGDGGGNDTKANALSVVCVGSVFRSWGLLAKEFEEVLSTRLPPLGR